MDFDLVVFGDSYTDGGHRGYGVAGMKAGEFARTFSSLSSSRFGDTLIARTAKSEH